MADLDQLVADILERPGPVRLVAVDGRGGAGKTTFASALAAAASAPLVHTDEYADAAGDDEWWPTLLRDVIEPLVQGRPGTVPAEPIVVIEGVSAARREWADHLSFVIWMETPTAVRRERMLERDGPAAATAWTGYEAEEDTHFAADPVWERADLIVG